MLLAAAPRLAPFVSRLFYRLSLSGPPVPRRGPVLLVANHPNSIIDPVLLIVAARRAVRFLAAARLFQNPVMGGALRAAGAIPVYRRIDDPSQTSRNEEAFHAAHAALAAGAAVGIFPEGISHDEPRLVSLRTGAARIALGATGLTPGAFPIVPVGLVCESKQDFRSRAHVVTGRPIAWDDLALRSVEDQGVVRELTARIEAALHAITVNYEQWQDAPLVRAATETYTAELGDVAEPAQEVAWRGRSAVVLAELRRSGDAEAAILARDVQRHMRLLRVLGLTPQDVHRGTDLQGAAGWMIRRVPAGLLPAIVILAAMLLFWVPYRLTGILARRYATGPSNLATCKLFYGIGIFAAWIIMLAILAGVLLGWTAAVIALVLLPAMVMEALAYMETSVRDIRDVRSFLVRRAREDRMARLRERQRNIGRRLRLVRRRARNLGLIAATPAGESCVHGQAAKETRIRKNPTHPRG